MKNVRLGLLMFLVTLSAPIVSAQTTPDQEQGLKPYGTFEGGNIDSVSMTTGNLTLHVPLFSYAQRGGKLTLDLELLYNDHGWLGAEKCSGQNCYYFTTFRGGQGVYVDDSQHLYTSATTPPLQSYLVTADGSQHLMEVVTGGARSLDASGLFANAVNGGSYAIDSGGVRYTPPTQLLGALGTGQVPAFLDYAYQKEDANGNQVAFSPTGGWTDTLGRVIPTVPHVPSYTSGTSNGILGGTATDSTGCQGPLAIENAVLWVIPGPSGGSTQLKLCFAAVTLKTDFTGHDVTSTTGSQMLQSIVLYNGSSWTSSKSWEFEYNSSDSNCPTCSYGDLTRVTFPTGGSISYTWATAELISAGFSRIITSRTVDAADGTGPHTWTYLIGNTPTLGVSAVSTAPAIAPATVGNDTVYTSTAQDTAFGPGNSFYVTQEDHYQGSHTSGTLLKTIKTIYSSYSEPYNNSVPGDFIPFALNVVPVSRTTIWANGQQSEISYTYDSGFSFTDLWGNSHTGIFGKVLTKNEFDYGSGAPGPLLRTTTTNYLALTNPAYLTNNLLNLPSSETISGSPGASTTFAYDAGSPTVSGVSTMHDSNPPDGTARGNQTSVSKWLNTTGGTLVTNNTFYDTGMVLQTKDPKNNATSFAYSSTYLGSYPTTVTNAAGQVTQNTYDANTGLIASTIDPNNQTTSYSYDGQNWRNTLTTYPDGGQTSFCYSDTGSEGCAAGPPYQINISKKISSSPLLSLKETIVIDGLGRNIQDQITSDPSGTDITDITYDAAGHKATLSNPYRTSGSVTTSSEGTTSYQYDALDRPTLVSKPDGSTTHSAYCGSATLATDEGGHWRRSRTDGVGHMVEVDEPNSTAATVNVCPGSGEPTWVTTYIYDTLDDLTSAVQGGSRARAFTYDSLKRMLTSSNPEAGAVSYTYDADSNVLTKKDGRNITITYGWDALNRMTSRTYSNGDPTVTYTYDQTTCVVVTTCYNVGRRTSMTDAGGSEKWAYDKMGREIGEQRTTNAITKNTSYTYNLDGSLATLTYPSGTVATFAYNAAAQLSNEGALGNSYLIANGYYTPAGGLMTLSLGGTANLTTIYNSRLQPCWVYESSISTLPWNDGCTQTTPTNGNILDLKYNFNLGADNGNVVNITNNRDTTRSQAFTYDQVNRVITGQTPAPCGSNCWSQTFTYDEWTNLQAVAATGTAPPLTNLGVNTSNRITLAGFTYDLAGNETTDVTNTYVWNAESEIKNGGGIAYTYDGDGGRVQKSNGKIYWYGAGNEILDESDASGNITDEYIYFGGKRVAHRVVSTNALTYYAEDMLGSSRSMLTSTGSLCYDADFYPFGGEYDFTNTCAQNYKFMGKERDPETNNDDFEARYYSSAYGRFLSADWSSTPNPVPYANLTNPQTLNLYSIVRDNPESYSDLDGHCVEDACVVEGAVFLAIVTTSYLQSPQGQQNLRVVINGISAAVSYITERKGVGSSGGDTAGKRFTPDERAQGKGESCAYCGQATTEEAGHPNSRETDHVKPKAQGGNTTPANTADACRTCNRQKGNRTPEQWKKGEKAPKGKPAPDSKTGTNQTNQTNQTPAPAQTPPPAIPDRNGAGV